MNLLKNSNFFTESLKETDPSLFECIGHELGRQREEIELIASENITSLAVMEAQGSVMTNKYAEGYSGRRYYGGCQHVDEAENLAIDRALKLFNCKYANVQPNSGSQANQAVFLALLKPGDKFLSMDLNSGGHLTHGAKPNQSGKWFEAVHYGVNKETSLIDYEEISRLAKTHKPKLIIAGGSAIPREIDFKKFRDIASSIGAFLLVDMAHIAGLVATGHHQSPVDYADVVTTTTHKTLRGPRGGLILTNSETLAKKFNSAVFPGLQGGPLMHVIAAKAVAFGEALRPEFKDYQKNVIRNSKILAKTLITSGIDVVTGGTDNHLLVVDLRSKKVTGKQAEETLGKANITCNKNSIPFDPEKPTITSGIRLGTPAGTTRGFGEHEFVKIGNWISELIDTNSKSDPEKIYSLETKVRSEVQALCKKFPIYSLL